MNLEDHIGDIIAKGRTINHISASAAATAAGISDAELSALEKSGDVGNLKINFAALGKLIGLPPQKLEAIAKGWLPKEKDLGIWRELRVFTTADKDDGMTVNCYLVWDEATRDAALFDTGMDATPVLKCLSPRITV